MQEKTIYLIRHGETELNRQRIIQGSGVDAPLNQRGLQQSRAFFDTWQHIPFEVVMASTLIRTHQTVAPWKEAGLPVEQFHHINEISWGDHEGKPGEPHMVRAYKTMIAQWSSGNFDARLPNGESAAELSARTKWFVDHLRERPESHILVCAHGRTMRCLLCHFRGEHLREMEKYRHSNTGLYQLRFDGKRFEIELENDIRHLENLAPGVWHD